MGDFCWDTHQAAAEDLCLLFFVLIEMPIIISLSNYSFLLGSGCFHNSPTLPLPCVWLCFSCNHTGFWCCLSLICFTGMNDCCSPKCILTAPHHRFPRHQKLPVNFLLFVSHSFGVCCPGVQCFMPFYFCIAVTVHIGFQWGCLVQKELKDTGFGQEDLNAQKAMGECLLVTIKNSKCCGTTLKVLGICYFNAEEERWTCKTCHVISE